MRERKNWFYGNTLMQRIVISVDGYGLVFDDISRNLYGEGTLSTRKFT